MQVSRLLPKRFSVRLIVMTFISGLIPIIIFTLLMNTFDDRFLTQINRAIQQGQEEQWQRSEAVLKQMAEDSVRQKALDVALQLELYLQAHPAMTVADLQNDPKFREMAVQPVGKTGYTAVYESDTAITRFHRNSGTVNLDLHSLSHKLLDFWAIMEPSLHGRYSHGYYRWKEPNGDLRDKFMYIAPLSTKTAEGVRFNVAATTYIDEFTRSIQAAQDVSHSTTRYLTMTANRLIESFGTTGFLFMGIGVALVLALACWAGLYFSRAINHLREATSAVNQGAFDTRLKRIMSGDVGELIEDFNQMIAQLATTTVKKEQLEASEKKLRATNEKLQREIIERKQAEEEKMQLEVQLQRAQKMEAIGTLAGGVAHDLNNILSGLVSYPELLLMDIPEDSPLRKPILTIQESGQKAAVIVQDLLTLARRGVATTKVLNLNDIISDLLTTPECDKLRAFHSNIQLETNLDTDLLNILGSSVHLSKTVMNLVSNAAEAMPGGGKITISTANQYIDRPIKGYENVQEGDYAVVSVSDSGIGISPEDLARIFEPFYTKKVMGRSGTGLGMAVVWGTVKDHNGYVDVQSTPGEGTRCDLYFPVTREELTEKKTTVSVDKYMGSESILVVDDVLRQREIASQVLSKLGYSITSVSSGEEAIEYLKSNSADLLVLDMIMEPGIDGLETYRSILELHPGQKAIIASGFSETERVKEAQKLGAGAYIRKPYLLEKIGSAVRSELDR